MKSPAAAKRFFLGLLVGTTILLVMVLRPFAEALFMAAVLAGVLWPLNKKLSRKLKRRRSAAAAILVAGVVVLVLGPLIGLSAFVYREASAGLKFVNETVKSEGVQGLLEKLPAPLQKVGAAVIEQLPKDAEGALDEERVGKSVTAQGGRAAAVVGSAVSATGSLVLQIVMMLVALYFLLLQGEELIGWLDQASPLRIGQTRELLAEFKKVSYAVLLSTVITSAVQAVVALVGYLIARVPHPVFFAAVTFFVAFIPAVGAGAVCLSAALLLFATGHPYMAIFLAIWGLAVVGLVDNVVKPLLMKGEMQMNGAVVFFALLGGLAAFGAVGLLIGPLVISAFLALMRMYRRDFSEPVPQPGVEAPPAAPG
ncbi:MAG: family transporter [Myxococcaceae bacterium]|nr:family transporter [Myxococcaceae bacterium]